MVSHRPVVLSCRHRVAFVGMQAIIIEEAWDSQSGGHQMATIWLNV